MCGDSPTVSTMPTLPTSQKRKWSHPRITETEAMPNTAMQKQDDIVLPFMPQNLLW